MPNTSVLVKKTDYNTKISKIEGKIPDVCDLATRITLTTVENKIPSVSNLVQKTDYNKKITEIENKLNNHNHNKYTENITSKLNNQNRFLILNCQILIEKLLKMKQFIYFFKMN